MILLLDTSTPICKLTIVNGEARFTHEWEANRELANGILQYLDTTLHTYNLNWTSLTGIVVCRGPGSFTGLRIGITVMNTIAQARAVSIVGASGDDWQNEGLRRLESDENDRIVLPEYGGEANITQPRK